VTNTGALTSTSGSSAYGIDAFAGGGDSPTYTVTNSGAIRTTATGNESGGIFVESTSASVTNRGSITAIGTGSSYAAGIDTTGNTVSITNQGTLQVSSVNAGVLGIYGDGTTITISNTQAVSASSTSSYAYGIYSRADGASTVTNSGALTVSGGPSAYGINAQSTSGPLQIGNTAAIHATSTSGTVSGIYTYTPTGTETVNNTGALTVSGSGYTYGIYAPSYAGNTATLDLFNSGAIQATAGASQAGGIFVLTASAHVVNQGAITATGTGSAYAVGIDVNSGPVSLSNSGLIHVSAQGGGVDGIFAYGNTDTVSNYQAISATSVSGYAYAIYSRAQSGAEMVTNTGSLTTSAGDYTYGINAQSLSGSAQVVNTGAIHVSSTGNDATGISVASTTTGTVTNSGAISGNAQGAATGISLSGGVATLTNTGAITLSATGTVTGLETSTGDNNSTITNSGAIQLTGGAAPGVAIQATNAGTSTATIANTGNLSVTTHSSVYGIEGVTNHEGDNYSILNSGSINLVTNGSSSGNLDAYGISASAAGNQSIVNHGSITISGSSSHVYANGINCVGGEAAIINTGNLNISGSGYAVGLFADAALELASIHNTGAISATGNSNSAYAEGIFILSGGQVDNQGRIAVSANNYAYGIGVRSLEAEANIINLASVTAASAANTASGLYIDAITGYAYVDNRGRVSGTSGSATYVGAGISTQAAAGATTIFNSGYAGGFNTGGGKGYGISVDPAGPIIVTNTGTAIGTTAGIFLTNTGTVNNSGLASGGTYSIQVPSGSTVNLNGASPVKGLLKGGADDTSTSQLNFNLAISGNHLATSQAALNAAIALYGAAYTTAGGDGANVDSEVVTINGIAYQWEDFLGIADNLVQGRLYGATPGYQGIGNAIDNFNTGSARGTQILNSLDNLPDSDVANALAQLSPKALQVFRNIAFDGASFTAANVNNHLANQRDGLTGFDTSGFSINTPGVDPMLTQMRSRLLAFNPAPLDHGLLSDSGSSLFGALDPKDTKAAVNTQPLDRWSAFISGSVILANLDNTTSTIGDSSYTTGSVLAGVDYRLDDHFTVGALFNYAHTGADLDGNGSKATVDSYAPGIYGSYVDKGWYCNAMLVYGFNNNTEDRQVNIPGLMGDNHGAADGGQVTSNLTGGYEFQRGPFKFGPLASLQYVHLTVGSFQEQGPTSLSIDRQEADSLRTQLGFEARYNAQVSTCYGPLELTPHFQASWQHENLDNSDGISSQFNAGAGGGSFVVQGQHPERDSAFLDLGVDAEVAKNVTVFVDYQTQVGQQNYFAQSAEGGVRIGF
jgi:uncharacterized protein YhjY with autotransporter beta-barrel domain